MSVFDNQREAPTCAAEGCTRPVDHRIHNVVIDGTPYDVPTCGSHGPDSEGTL